MFKEMLISIDEMENRVAVLEDGKLMEIYISREDRQIGSIYKGKVANILPGMQAAFIDIGLERNAFLGMDDASAIFGEEIPSDFKSMSIRDVLKVNQETLVQIVKESWGLKGARVTTHITLPGRYLVLLPSAQYVGISRRIEDEQERERLRRIAEELKNPDFGIIIRTAAEGHTVEELENDLRLLEKQWEKIQQSSKRKKAPLLVHQELNLVYKLVRDLFTADIDRLTIDSKVEYGKILELVSLIAPELKSRVKLFAEKKNLFESYGIEVEMEKALRRRVWLESGGFLVIDKTEALTVIDVNTGKFVGKNNLNETIFKINMESIPEIARQLRLRDIGGIVVVDFIDMDSEHHQQRVLDELQVYLKKDHTKTHLVGMTELGLVQITRKRVSKDLDEYLRGPCPYCNGRGRVYSLSSMHVKCEREIKKVALDKQFSTILVEVHPRLAIEMLGLESEDMERLEKITNKSIILRANMDVHLEKLKVETIPEKTVKELNLNVQEGSFLELDIIDVFGSNPNDGLAVFEKVLVDIQGAGNRVGERLKVVVQAVNKNCISAEIRE